MPNLDRVWYPHALYLTGGTSITQLNNPRPSNNFRDLLAYSASQAGPQFSGTHQAMPDFTFGTPQIKTILGTTNAARFRMSSGLLSGSNLIEYLAGANAGVRDNGGTNDVVGTAEKLAIFVESITARQGEIAEAQCRAVCLFDSASGNDPLVFADDSNVSTTAQAAENYTLGLCQINGVDAGCMEELTLSNNITYEEVPCAGLPFCSYCGIRTCAPVVRIVTNKMNFLETYGSRGVALSGAGVVFFLQKKLISGINVPAATTGHLKFAATTGTVKAREANGSKAMCVVEIQLTQSAANTSPVTYTADQAMAFS